MAAAQFPGGAIGGGRVSPRVLFLVVLGAAAFLAVGLSALPGWFFLATAFTLTVFFISFLKPEFGIAILILSMLFSPEVGVGAFGGGSVEAGRRVVLRLDDVLLVILSAAWFARTAVYKELGLFLRTPLNRPIAAYVVTCIISTALGILMGAVKPKLGFFFVIRYIEYFILFFMTVNYVQSDRQMRRFVGIALLTGALVALYGIFQIPAGGRLSAPFEGEYGEPNTLGGYLVLLMSMALGLMLKTRKTIHALGWLAYVVLLSLPLLFTGSRGSWIALGPMALAFLIFARRPWLVAGGLLLLLAAAPILVPQGVQDRLLYTFRAPRVAGAPQIRIGGTGLDPSTSARLESWEQGIEGWMSRPILGYGVTGFYFMDSQYVRTLVETGLLGFVAFLWLLITYFRVGREALRRAPGDFQQGVALGYLAGLFAMATHSVGANTFIILRIMEPFMLFTGIAITIGQFAEVKAPEGKGEGESPPGEDESGRDGGAPARVAAVPAAPAPARPSRTAAPPRPASAGPAPWSSLLRVGGPTPGGAWGEAGAAKVVLAEARERPPSRASAPPPPPSPRRRKRLIEYIPPSPGARGAGEPPG